MKTTNYSNFIQILDNYYERRFAEHNQQVALRKKKLKRTISFYFAKKAIKNCYILWLFMFGWNVVNIFIFNYFNFGEQFSIHSPFFQNNIIILSCLYILFVVFTFVWEYTIYKIEFLKQFNSVFYNQKVESSC